MCESVCVTSVNAFCCCVSDPKWWWRRWRRWLWWYFFGKITSHKHTHTQSNVYVVWIYYMNDEFVYMVWCYNVGKHYPHYGHLMKCKHHVVYEFLNKFHSFLLCSEHFLSQISYNNNGNARVCVTIFWNFQVLTFLFEQFLHDFEVSIKISQLQAKQIEFEFYRIPRVNQPQMHIPDSEYSCPLLHNMLHWINIFVCIIEYKMGWPQTALDVGMESVAHINMPYAVWMRSICVSDATWAKNENCVRTRNKNRTATSNSKIT